MIRLAHGALALIGLAVVPAAGGAAQERGSRQGGQAAVPPATLTAVSTIPTQIVLNWPSVTGAEGYRVTRAIAGEPETPIYEGRAAIFAVDRGMCADGKGCWFPDNNVALEPLYSYRVASVFPGAIYSEPGPVASARSARFQAPANLTHAVVASTIQSGLLQVTVSWLPVSGAEAYFVAPATAGLSATTVRTASVRFDGLRPGSRHRLCVSAIYPPNIRDDSVKRCMTLVL